MHQIQLPHQIGTGLSRSTTGGFRGMDSGMASELARMKSRDVAIENNEEMYDRPRMATPKSRREDGSRSPTASGSTVLVQHRSFRGEEKSMPQKVSVEGAALSSRPHSIYAESIPPLPELPTNVGKKVSKIEGMAAKKLYQETALSSPIDSARNSQERPGDSTESIASAVRRAVSSRKSQEANQHGNEKRATPLRSEESRQVRPDSTEVRKSEEGHQSGSRSRGDSTG